MFSDEASNRGIQTAGSHLDISYAVAASRQAPLTLPPKMAALSLPTHSSNAAPSNIYKRSMDF